MIRFATPPRGKTRLFLVFVVAIVAAFASVTVSPAVAQETLGSITDRVAFDQKLGDHVPLDATFRDERGRSVRLGDYFNKRPVILTLVYFNCPLLCTQVLNALTRSLKPLSLDIGKDFDVVTVSIDPSEEPSLAAAKKEAYLARYDRPSSESRAGWHFLTGETPSIEALSKSVGFKYSYSQKTKLYAHAAGIVILSPTGLITRYFYGLDYPSKDVQFVLKEASAGKVGSPMSRVLLLCYDYDAATGKYTLSILRILRVAGVATAVAVATYMAIMFWRDRRGSLRGPLGAARSGTADLTTP